MSSTLIRGKYVLCRIDDQDTVELIDDGAIFQQDGEIIDVGKYDSIKVRYIADEEIGSDQHMVLPGLINSHQHGRGVSYLLKGTPDDNLEPWLIKLMEQKTVDHYLDTMYCILRLIESGVTTVMHSHFPRSPYYEEEVKSILKAYQDGGIRVAFALGIRNQNHLVYQDDQKFLESLPSSLAARTRKYLTNTRVSEEEYFALFARLNEEYGANTISKIRILHGPAAPQWCSGELLIRIKHSADKYHTGIHAHMLETIYQKIYASNRFGKTFVEHLNEIGFLGPKVSFAHCVWLTEDDIELLARNGTSVCHNPSSNLRLKSGIAPVNRMLEKKVNVALGTDGAAINDDESILQEIRLCANLHRTPGLGKFCPTPGQLLKMVTVNGAKVTLFSDQIGTLEKGKRADIILVNLKEITEPYLDPELSIVNAFIGRGKTSDVDIVMIDGEIVLRNKKHTRINKEEIVTRLKESFSRDAKPADMERRRLAQDLYPHVIEFYQNWKDSEIKPHYIYNSVI